MEQYHSGSWWRKKSEINVASYHRCGGKQENQCIDCQRNLSKSPTGWEAGKDRKNECREEAEGVEKTGSAGTGHNSSNSVKDAFQDLMEVCVLEQTSRFLKFTIAMLTVAPEKSMEKSWMQRQIVFPASQL